MGTEASALDGETTLAAHEWTDIERLNSFLRAELSAIEAYDRCIGSLSDRHLGPPLRALRGSHEDRARWLAERIAELGGTPVLASIPWGGLTKALERGTSAFSDRKAIAVLERGEVVGQADYNRDLPRLSPDSRQFVVRRILPEQRWTRDSVREIRRLHP